MPPGTRRNDFPYILMQNGWMNLQKVQLFLFLLLLGPVGPGPWAREARGPWPLGPAASWAGAGARDAVGERLEIIRMRSRQ